MKIDLLNHLICPVCHGNLQTVNDKIICQNCFRSYPFSCGMIDLRIDTAKKGDWDLNTFEKAYQEKEAYKDVYEYAALDKIPHFAEELRYRKVKGRLKDLLNPPRNALILDLGCGNGYFIFDFLQRYPNQNISIVGLDVAEPNIVRLNQRLQEEHRDNIIGLLGEAEKLPFASGIFDLVISSEVVEHMYHPAQAFQEVHRILKPGGRFFITTPARPVTNFWNALFWLPVTLTRRLKGKPKPQLAYDEPLDKRRLRNYLTRAGFKIVRLEQNALMPHESYLPHFPPILTRLALKSADWLERRFKRLVSFSGLHYLIECQK